MVLNTTGSSRIDKAARWFDWSQITLTASQTVQVGRLDIMAEPPSRQTKKLVERGVYVMFDYVQAQPIGFRSRISPGTTVIARYMLAA